MTSNKLIGFTTLIILLVVVALPLLTSVIKFAIFAAIVASVIWLINRSLKDGPK